MPICDGSHSAEGWRCDAPGVDKIEQVFVASTYLRNLADRLAWKTGGVSLHMTDGEVHCDRLVVLTDGHGAAAWVPQLKRVHAEEILIVGVGPAASRLARRFPEAVFVAVPDDPIEALWAASLAAISGEGGVSEAEPMPRIFLSHAVADETALFPIIERLREEEGADIFVCADSIVPGTEWQAVLKRELRARDLFLFVSTAASKVSAFCAFEAGIATALGKPIRIVSPDGTTPPAHLQHIQSMDAERLRMRKPWLLPADATYEACLLAIRGGDSAHV